MSNNKTVLVTGGSSGLGAQFCRTLAANGYTVVAAARRLEQLQTLCAEIEAAGGKAYPLELDVTDLGALAGAIDKAEAVVGPITCLVNNAGSSVSKKAVDMTPEDFDFVVDLNLKAPYFLCTEFARRWIANGIQGRIVNVGSVSDRKAMPGHTVYGTTKAAIARLTQQFAREWINKGICVNALAPGYIRTELNAEYFDSPAGQAVTAFMPRRRVGKPSDLDKAILYLCEPDQDFLTGQVLALDDGQCL
ncbi:SDR family NAD(P)-dependent oxidoreductase [Microbulbifer agarilyticus]|uniref:SDR family NAD(P)-dependent oxidoreductase n=1 Tax=Microbulbifer agarilyticus TaxID=260552 RepID=UPI001C973884|nr:SDR family NAD(P)-dependent oxidoreductase [Microbulbifer agarilyticus]MBY6211702.1 SDR family NAD(P)-dependent oxidoreductase [Microbulbifer agarilyticus]